MATFHESTFLKLIKVWDYDDSSLYNKEEKKLTSKGYISYWEAVDKAVKFADTILLKKDMLKKKKNQIQDQARHQPPPQRVQQHNHPNKNFDSFHWRRGLHQSYWRRVLTVL